MDRDMTLIKPAQSIIEANRQSQTGVARYRFPNDLGAHAMIFNFKSYEYRGGQPVTTIIDSSVALPLPSNIVDSYSIQVGPRELGIFGAAASDLSSRMNDGNGLINALSELASTTADNVSSAVNSSSLASTAINATRYLARAGLTTIPGGSGVESGISAGTGTAINPHAAIVFDGISLKTHTFEWLLAPKSATESEQAKNIINAFKKAALPSYTDPLGASSLTGTSFDRALLKYPSMVDIFFVGLNQEYYFYFKTCMINNITVDYAPQGQSLFKGEGGSRPVMMNFKVDLTEAQIHTKEDYTDNIINMAGR